LENLKGRDHLKDLGLDMRTIMEWILKKETKEELNEFISVSIRTNGGLS
jgi:transposase